MEKMKTLYNSQTYNTAKAFLYALPALVVLVALVMVIARFIHSEAFAVIGWVLACSVPFLFQKAYKRLFTRRVELEFDKQNFLIKEYTSKNDDLVKELTIAWAEIQSYKCSFSSSNIVYLVIYLKDGSSKSFSFKDEKSQEQALNEKSVFSIFNYYVSQYNLDKQPECEITFEPGFLTTKSGALVLYSLTILAVIGIVIHFVLAPKTFMLSFMSFFIIMGLLVKRKTDKNFYNKINQLEPRPPID
jgi:positive regulator of sigma E activity